MFVGMVDIGSFADHLSDQIGSLFLRDGLSFVGTIDENVNGRQIVFTLPLIRIGSGLKNKRRASFFSSIDETKTETETYVEKEFDGLIISFETSDDQWSDFRSRFSCFLVEDVTQLTGILRSDGRFQFGQFLFGIAIALVNAPDRFDQIVVFVEEGMTRRVDRTTTTNICLLCTRQQTGRNRTGRQEGERERTLTSSFVRID